MGYIRNSATIINDSKWSILLTKRDENIKNKESKFTKIDEILPNIKTIAYVHGIQFKKMT